MKRKLFFTFLLSVLLLFVGCLNPCYAVLLPDRTPGYTWTTTDGTITFTVGEEETVFAPPINENSKYGTISITSNMFGTIVLGEKTWNFFAMIGPDGSGMILIDVSVSDLQNESSMDEYYEVLRGQYALAVFEIDMTSRKRMVATVEGGSIFEVGTEFEFVREKSK